MTILKDWKVVKYKNYLMFSVWSEKDERIEILGQQIWSYHKEEYCCNSTSSENESLLSYLVSSLSLTVFRWKLVGDCGGLLENVSEKKWNF